jgi:hypothetical protein
MVSCECGQIFQSDAALAQHRADKARLGDRAHLCQVAPAPSAVRATAARPRHSRIDVWIWKDVISRKALRTIDGAAIQPAATPVSSQSACDLVSSYNWQDTAEPRIRIPGEFPINHLNSGYGAMLTAGRTRANVAGCSAADNPVEGLWEIL